MMTFSKLLICGTALTLVGQCVANAAPRAKSVLTFDHYMTSGESDPRAGLTMGAKGVFYGTTYAQNGTGYGTVYSYDSVAKKETTLYSFQALTDGAYPYAGITYDPVRNAIYGATQVGGGPGKHKLCGTIFKIDLATNKFSVLYTFTCGADGNNPAATMTLDPTGKFLWGTTETDYVPATIFKFDLTQNALTTAYTFTNGLDGSDVYACQLLWDSTGTILYGTADNGGQYGWGNLFQFNTVTGVLTPLHQFNESGSGPDGFAGGWGLLTQGLVMDANGVLYGSTLYGGTAGKAAPGGAGTLYTYDTKAGVFKTIYTFSPDKTAPTSPWTGLTFDSQGTLWGATNGGGSKWNSGTVFKYVPSTGVLTQVYAFNGANPKSGYSPFGKLVFYNNAMWGTTSANPFSYGTIYSVTTK